MGLFEGVWGIDPGVLIDDDVIDFANREMSNVVLSLDGRKEVHDKFRVDLAGNGSWEKIVPKFQKLVQARGGKNYYMRGTFTHNNPDFLEDIISPVQQRPDCSGIHTTVNNEISDAELKVVETNNSIGAATLEKRQLEMEEV